jgi:hypothetical protein
MFSLFVALHLVAPFTPATTLRELEQAFARHDMRAVAALVEGGSYSAPLARFERILASSAGKPLTIGLTTPDVRDDTALVRVLFRFYQNPLQEKFAMRRVNGRWLFSPQPEGALRDEGRILTAFLRATQDVEKMEALISRFERIIREKRPR